MMSQDKRKWATVRIAAELMGPIEKLFETAKDDFGMPCFRSKSDIVTEAVREFLRKNLLPGEDADPPKRRRLGHQEDGRTGILQDQGTS